MRAGGLLCSWGLLERKARSFKPSVIASSFLGAVLADPKLSPAIWTICYRRFSEIELRFSMILILLIGPNLISQDLALQRAAALFLAPAATDRLFPRQARRDRRVPARGAWFCRRLSHMCWGWRSAWTHDRATRSACCSVHVCTA
jgi:hypothetical protein